MSNWLPPKGWQAPGMSQRAGLAPLQERGFHSLLGLSLQSPPDGRTLRQVLPWEQQSPVTVEFPAIDLSLFSSQVISDTSANHGP